MKVRKINGSERFDAYLISAYCFHSRIDDVESERERIEGETIEDWGAFTDDGTLAARIVNNKFKFYIDGLPVCAGGIGAVSTLPEYREKGAVREIFRELLPEAYRNGQVISALFPFNHAFYRKQGYEVVTFQSNYELNPAILSGYKFDGTVTRWNPGEPVDEYLKLYNEFAVNYNFAMLRDERSMMEHMKVDKLYQERKFSYILSKNGENIAYIIFTDIKSEPAAILHVEECAWINRDGFHAILAFLGRFEADYGKIQLPLPQGIDLLRVIRTKRAYEIHKTCRHDFMVRVINVQKLLEIIKKPVDCDFVIKVSDELIPENNGVWRVTAGSVKIADEVLIPDLEVSERALAQMAVGCINLDEAMLRPDVEINANEEMLRRVFIEKKIFVGEHF
ncbi:MAG: enhanced intracellular survival protein Eis [Lachnospiraceae bacterium]